MIMIDPKMLELSMYRTFPICSRRSERAGKAIRALNGPSSRWRTLSDDGHLGVRQLASFNQKVRDAKAKGTQLGARFQTGYNADSGQPIYETKADYDVLPQIVVIIAESCRPG